MTVLVDLVLTLVGLTGAAFGVYLLVLAVASLGYRQPSDASMHSRSTTLAVLVPAHDEENLVARCVRSLLDQTYPRPLYRVIVVADNCSDQTASVAAAAGAEVMVRENVDARGKGRALRWAMDHLLAEPETPDAIVVVDADSLADRGLLAGLEQQMASGTAVVQADYRLLIEPDSSRSALMAAGFLLFHRVRFSGRARFGMPANLVGNGMLFSRSVLEAHPWDAFIGAEDLEYSINLALAGVRPRFAPSAVVSGPGPASRRGAVRQRLRWEGGRFYVVRTRLAALVYAALRRRDLALLSTALDLATPPLGMLCLTVGAGVAVTMGAVLTGLALGWCLISWAVALFAIPAYVVVGLRSANAPKEVWWAVLRAPAFLAWKSTTYIRLLRGFDPRRWDRTDRANVSPHDIARIDIAGVPIDPVDMPTALSRLREAIGGSRLFQVATINLDFMVSAQNDRHVRDIYRRSNLNIADGAPVVWLGRILGARVPGRVAGADLVPALVGEASKIGARVFLLGGENGAAHAASVRLKELHPDLTIAGTYEPPRASVEGMDNERILEQISLARPDVLLVAFGHPKQERWIDLHRERLPVSVAIGVGCVFDLLAGRSRRAPRWMQDAGLEWFYRLLQEPRRLLTRYFLDAAWLIPITMRTLRSRLSAGFVAESA